MISALNKIGMHISKKEDEDGISLRVYSAKRALLFFNEIGSENVKHKDKYLSWRQKNPNIGDDYLKFCEIRKGYKWSKIAHDLIERDRKSLIRDTKINDRSIRKWRQGIRVPHVNSIPSLLNLMKKNSMDLKDYKNG